MFFSTKWRLGAAGLLAMLSLAFAGAPALAAGEDPYHPPLTDAMPPLDVLVGQFERIAFSNEFGGQHRRGRIVKWARPLRVRVRGKNARRYRREITDMLAQLRRLTGLRMRLLGWNDPSKANFEIHFVAKRPAGQSPCATFIRDKRFAITHVRIIISANNLKLRRHCIAEELTQALGLGDDSSLVFPSIFHDSSRQQVLMPWDEIMLQTLYDRRLYPGIRLGKARPIVREVMSGIVARMPVTTHSPPNQMELDPSAFK